jgi:pimeloyl-ACP methyl ester carboxylesterase
MKISLALLLVTLTVTAASAASRSPRPYYPPGRIQTVDALSDMREVLPPQSIQRSQAIQIGGINQWVSIRGKDRRNPILLVLHGGPGYVLGPMSWWFQPGWEDYFTVVEWDQRGAGKTFLINDPKKIAPTMTRERMVADAAEMVSWLRKEFGKKKIFLLGHSWGSYMGLALARLRPEWFYAYIGTGQITDGPESERRGWRFAMDEARKEGNRQAIRELQAIAPYGEKGKPITLKDLYVQRKWVGLFGGVMAYRGGQQVESKIANLSPDYSDQEIRRIWDGNRFSEKYLLAEVINTNMTAISSLDCPLILLEGRHDYNVNAQLAADWFAKVKAPSKQFVWFEHSGHEAMNEEPGKFLVSLVRYARPFAEKAGDVAP